MCIRDRACSILSKAQSEKEEGSKKKEELEQDERLLLRKLTEYKDVVEKATTDLMPHHICNCLLYTSDAADERSSVDLGGRRIIKKKNKKNNRMSNLDSQQ